jgi:hypothetical protein
MQSSAAMLKNMKPEDLQRLQGMSSQMMGSGAAPGQAPNMSDMGAMLKDPNMMKQAMSMMQGMSEDDLANMLKMSQPGMDDTKARQCVHLNLYQLF